MDIKEQEFPRKVVPIDLKGQEAAVLTASGLSTQLGYVGLTCSDARGERVLQHMDEVIKELPFTSSQAYAIYDCDTNKLFATTDEAMAFVTTNEKPFYGIESSIAGEWSVDPTGYGYLNELYSVVDPRNYNRLKAQFADFTGIEVSERVFTSTDTNVSKIVAFIANILTEAAQSILGGIDMVSMKAACTQMLEKDVSQKANYTLNKSFIICLVENYNETTKAADAIAAIWFTYELVVVNYKDKKASDHKATLTTSSHSVQYTNPDILTKHYNWAQNNL